MTRLLTMTPVRVAVQVLALALLASINASSPAFAAEVSPFNTLLGSWGGGGTMALEDGSRARLSCNAYYTGGGTQLRLAIYCSSGSNNIKMRGNLSYNGGRVSGRWEERTYNADGSLSGTASADKISVSISGNISGTMVVAFSKAKQSVSISTKGVALQAVNITLSRR